MDRHRSYEYRRRRSRTPPQRERAREVLTHKRLKAMPENLRKKAIREARNRNEPICGKRRQRRHKQKNPNNSQLEFERCEHNAMLAATAQQLKDILANCELLADIPYDYTPLELLGEIAIAKGQATTIYVKREGLSTLTIVLHQQEPTVANLKQAIAEISRAQHTRTQRERHEERLKRRGVTITTTTTRNQHDDVSDSAAQQLRQRQEVDSMPRSTGELVCSALRNGHEHRAQVSWRFLWRAFTLFNVDTNQPINDENGRSTLTALGIENAATLKLVHRVKYFRRKRQK